MSNDKILEFVDKMEDEVKAIKNEILKICWYMRGSVSLNEAWALSYDDRMSISKLIEDNLETTKKTNLPFF